MRVLLDTNVVIDFLLKRTPFDVEAKEIFRRSALGNYEIFVSSITPINAFYTIRKEKNKNVAFVSVEGLMNPVEISRTDKQVLQSAFTINFNDYEDAVQHESAVAENLDAIVTRNEKDFKNGSLQIYSPADFLKAL
ncbi:MAG: type II toxin-antitoxin system VapC family toxin [Aridibacter sp.]